MKNKTALFLLLLAANLTRSQTIFVSSRNNNAVKQYDLNGNFMGDFVAPGSGGLSVPQEVVWHPEGFLLVTGRGNTAVKKYDGATGAYLGNFTHGYSLDNPTKTTIWRDSLLYISQWGAFQNKVVRFDLKTGAFVDEFTSTGVPNGCGHAWDAHGRLLVAQFGDGVNGKVWKFDVDGMKLNDLIPSTLLQGPVNLWYGANDTLFVADWTLGQVLKFNGLTSSFVSVAITGMSNVEGYTFDAAGRLYLCDWTQNKVFRYDFSNSLLSPFITTGGLMAPNSILIREPVSPTSNIQASQMHLFVSPNPATEQVRIQYALKKASAVELTIVDALGQQVAQLFSGQQHPGMQEFTWSGFHNNGMRASAGVYFIKLNVGHESITEPLLWK